MLARGAAIIGAVAFLSGVAGVAAAATAASVEDILLDFEDHPLADIVEEVARATGLTVLMDASLKGRATLAAPRRVSRDEAIAILEAALLFGGYALLPIDENVRKLLPIADAAPGASLAAADAVGDRDSMVATVLTLEWADAAAVSDKLQHLVSRQGVAVAFEPTNSLILVGRENRMARLIGLAKLLDQEQGESRIWLRSLRYRTAVEVAALLRDVLARPNGLSAAQISGDDRANRLIVNAPMDEIAVIRDLVERLDQPEELTGDLEIVPVLFADPAQLATILRELSAGSGVSDRAQRAQAEAGLSGRSFAVEAETRTRSLLVHGDALTRERIRQVVAELDLPPRQVLLEFSFVEFSKPQRVSMSFDFFLPLSRPNSAGDPVASLFSNPSGGGLRSPDSDDRDFFFSRVGRAPLLLTAVDPGSGLPIQVLVPREQATLGAEDSSVTATLQSRPSLVAIAGEEHSLTVGNNIPVPVSASQGGAAVSSQFLAVAQRIERYDTGVHVRVRPTIGEAGEIRLDLYLKLDEVIESDSVDEVGPVLAQRQAETTILLQRGEIALVGMSQDQAVTESVRKVPFLGDIPYLGWFFRSMDRVVRDRQVWMTVQARAVDTREEMEAESIRQRLGLERSLARQASLPTSEDRPFTIRVASLTSERTAVSLESRLRALGFAAYRTHWNWAHATHHEVYVGSYAEVFEAVAESRRLREAGYRGELVVDAQGSGFVRPVARSAGTETQLALHP